MERICHNEEERHLRNSGHHEKDGNIDSRGMDNKDNGYDNYNDNNNSNNGEFITESGLYSPSNLSVKGFQRNPMYNNNNNNNNNNNKNDKNKDNENENQNQSQSQSQNKIHDYHSKQNHMNKSISHIGPHAESDNSNVSQKSFLSQIFIKSNSEKEVEVEKKREKEKKKENGNDRNIDRNIDRENEKENEKEIEKSTMNINHNGDRGGERGEGGRGSKGGVERILGRTRSVTAENILSRASFQSHTQSSKSAAAHANSRNNSYVDPLNLNSVTSTSTFGSIQNNDRKDNDNNDNNNHTNYYDNNNNSSSNMNDSSNSNYSHSILSCHSLTAEDQLELGGVSVSISDSESEFSDSLLHSDSPKSPFYASRLWIGGHIADNNLNNNNKNNNYSNNNSNSNNNINNSNLSNNNNINTKNDTSNSPLVGISPIPKVNYITDPTHLATHSNSYPNFTGTGSPIAKNKKTEKLNNLMKIDLKHDSDNSSNNNSSSKKNNKNNAEKTENLLQPRGRIKRAYSDIFFQMAIPENINTVTANNSRANSMVGANNVDLLRIKKLAEIDRQKKKASEKKSLLEKMMSANIDIFDNSTTVRKNIEKNNEGNNYNNDHNGYSNNIKNNNNPTTVLPYFIMKQLKKLGTSFSNFAYYFYEILILGPHAGESDMQEGEKPKKLIFL